MKISKIAGPSTFAIAAVVGVVISGCSPKPTPPQGDLGAESAAGQSAAMVARQSHDPLLQKQTGGFGGGQNAGQAAAMQARMHAQGQHP